MTILFYPYSYIFKIQNYLSNYMVPFFKDFIFLSERERQRESISGGRGRQKELLALQGA